VTPDELVAMMPAASSRAQTFADPLTVAMAEFDIDTARRQAAFLAQICHESGSLRYVRELASGDAYEGRADLGNTRPGDGQKFRGRGLLQITGRSNYMQCGAVLCMDLIGSPELLETPINACRSAGWFWRSRELNRYADADRYGSLTRAINGGYNHIDDRIIHWLRIRKVLGL